MSDTDKAIAIHEKSKSTHVSYTSYNGRIGVFGGRRGTIDNNSTTQVFIITLRQIKKLSITYLFVSYRVFN